MTTRRRPGNCCDTPHPPTPLLTSGGDRVVGMFKALADPTRLDIFRLVAAQDAPLCACDIVERFAVSQPTVSHHMKVLRDAGLILVSRRGVWAYYAVDPAGLASLQSALNALTPTPLAVAS